MSIPTSKSTKPLTNQIKHADLTIATAIPHFEDYRMLHDEDKLKIC